MDILKSNVYKYFDSTGLIKTIEELSVRCSYATDLNDIYDSQPPFRCSKKFEKSFIGTNHRDNSFQGFINSISRDSYITSFTSSGADNILMWGHYTNNYTGGVIEFDFSTHPILSTIKKVEYSETPISVSDDFCYFMNMDSSHKKDIKKAMSDYDLMLRVKSKVWEYESEWRYVTGVNKDETPIKVIGSDNELHEVFLKTINNKNYLYINITPQNIKKIYVGHLMSALDRLKLYHTLKKHNLDIPVLTLAPQYNNYKFDFKNNDFINLRYIIRAICNDLTQKHEMIKHFKENKEYDRLNDAKKDIGKYINTISNLLNKNIIETSNISKEDKRIASLILDKINKLVMEIKGEKLCQNSL